MKGPAPATGEGGKAWSATVAVAPQAIRDSKRSMWEEMASTLQRLNRRGEVVARIPGQVEDGPDRSEGEEPTTAVKNDGQDAKFHRSM